jgi:hypothetical protein
MSTLNVTTIIPGADAATNADLSLDGKGTGNVAVVDDATVGGTLGVTGATTLAAVTASGTPTFSSTDNMSVGGNLLLTTAAKGIYLGVTSATAANLLGDYEEGTWTPTFVSTSATFGYSTQGGTYTKVGRMCTASFRIRINGTPGGTTSNSLFVGGLPFAIGTLNGSYHGGHPGFYMNFDLAQPGSMAYQLSSGASTIEFKNIGDNIGEIAVLTSYMGSTGEIRGQIVYQTA